MYASSGVMTVTTGDGTWVVPWQRAVWVPGSTDHGIALAGASARTLARLFEREAGMTFGSWRQQLRLLRSLELLAGGESVTSVALSLGYESLSAFVSMFRRNLGRTPGRYFESGGAAFERPRERREQ